MRYRCMLNNRPHVLLVEGDAYVAKILTWVLTLLPIDVTAVATGEQALRALHAQDFKLLIIDNQLLDLTGTEHRAADRR